LETWVVDVRGGLHSLKVVSEEEGEGPDEAERGELR
jgi:hypothetical protein